MGHKIHSNFPSRGAKMKTKYLYLQEEQTNLSIFATLFALRFMQDPLRACLEHTSGK